MQYRLRGCSTGRGKLFALHTSARITPSQPILRTLCPYCTPSAFILHTFSLYTAHPQPVYCTLSARILHTLSLYTAQSRPEYCTISACILHTLSLYCTYMYLIQGGPVGLTSCICIYMYGGDLDAFGKPVHKDCFQKCICI